MVKFHLNDLEIDFDLIFLKWPKTKAKRSHCVYFIDPLCASIRRCAIHLFDWPFGKDRIIYIENTL